MKCALEWREGLIDGNILDQDERTAYRDSELLVPAGDVFTKIQIHCAV